MSRSTLDNRLKYCKYKGHALMLRKFFFECNTQYSRIKINFKCKLTKLRDVCYDIMFQCVPSTTDSYDAMFIQKLYTNKKQNNKKNKNIKIIFLSLFQDSSLKL